MAPVEINNQRKWLLGVLLVLIAGVTCLLNLQSMFFEPVGPWVRIAIPILLSVGFVGSVLGNKSLRLVGWVAIALCALFLLTGAAPGEDYTLGGPDSPAGPSPHFVSGWLVLCRVAVFLALVVSLIVCFKSLARMPSSTNMAPRS
jgi:hypothetical protein